MPNESLNASNVFSCQNHERGESNIQEHEVIIVGSGPAGSLCAKALKQEGIDVLILEKDKL
ncbi:FAD-dependent monooxygenase [Georgfuchsia toluolica]|uniref:FAD-dependent monooxygenase n=1 Tax=Georgfuchsia toluolica TaxID=424218 RepID=UPI001C73BD66